MENMANYLPKADVDKLKLVLDVKEKYNAGKLTLEEAKKILKEKVTSLKPYEIALAEQQWKELEDDECQKEDIQKMLELFEDIMDTSRPKLDEHHPIMCYYRENDELRKILLSIEDLVQYPVIKNQWLEIYDKLAQYRLHFSRKQNQLYATLEKKGFDRPTTTMWLLDDFVRDEIRDLRQLLDTDENKFIEAQKTLVFDMRDLMDKEETVLYPTSLAMITAEEFEDMKSGDQEIGFAWIETSEVKSVSAAEGSAPIASFAGELASLLGKYGYNTGSDSLLDVATGQLTLEQINLIYRHLPVDISYVDENELVRFYSDTDHRVFPRSKNVIGRNVKNCHPRTSVHVVEDIIAKFRSGEQNHAEFWINKPDFFIYIYYVAVRDKNGAFRGVLEMMQDCTHIRRMEGSRTLLTWDEEETEKKSTGENTTEKGATEEKITEEKIVGEKAIGNSEIAITPATLLKDLLAAYPSLKDKMEEISPKFKLLNSPLARVILPKATLAMMSEKSGVPLEKLINALQQHIDAIKQR